MAKTLYLMRHGQTLFNLRHKVQGWCDAPLTDFGVYQAKVAGQYFKDAGITFDDAYSSTQERACDTLELVTDDKLPYKRVKGLKEWNFGTFEGESEDLNPPLPYKDFFVTYGGEGVDQVGERVLVTLTEVMEQAGAEPVLAVSHGGAMWAFYLKIAAQALDSKVRFGNCAICHYQYEQGHFKLAEVIDPLTGSVYECE